jgi:SPP1 gp7 family putative phage head morphogenesis protein
MGIIDLTPIRERSSWFDGVESQILYLFKQEIYFPLIESLGMNKNILRNSLDDLIEAINSGRIFFEHDRFQGNFNAAISRELKRLGAEWDRRGFFVLKQIPIEVQAAIVSAKSRENAMFKAFDEKLQEIGQEQPSEKVKFEEIFDTVLWKVEDSLQKTIKGITVTPELSPDERMHIAMAYKENLGLYIQTWKQEEILKLRDQVEKRVFSGLRREHLAKIIERSYGVSKAKAKFLAKQETSLMVSTYKEMRYQSAGSEEYKWKCVNGSPKHPVRPLHLRLNNKIFRWDSPPITDNKGNRNNPGCDFGCRCVAIPRIRF